MSVLDDVLVDYDFRGGEVRRKIRSANGALKFGHHANFCCMQQPEGTKRDGYYIIYHMMEYVRARGGWSKDSDVNAWGRQLASITDADFRAELRRVQLQLGMIINRDVYDPHGEFHDSRDFTSEEIEEAFQDAGDIRPFNPRSGILPFIPKNKK